MMKTIHRKTRSSGSQPLPTGSSCGARFRGTASTYAGCRGKSGRKIVIRNDEHAQEWKMTLKLNEKLS